VPSARLLRSLPYPELMRRRLRTFAMLDTIVAPDSRSFEWHPHWGKRGKREQMGAFKDGQGNFFFAWFSPKGAVLRGFDHESVMSPFQKDPPEIWPGMFDGLPKSLDYAKREPAFALDEITFCLWAPDDEGEWQTAKLKSPRGRDPDGSAALLACFHANFHKWANEYYDTKLDGRALNRLWEEERIDWASLEALNVDFDERAVREEAELLEWPIDLSKRNAPPKKAKRAAKAKARPAPEEPSQRDLFGKPASGRRPKVASFGAAEFVVRCEPTRVVLRVHDKNVAISHENVYRELFELVRARLEQRE
jgi:hypothetical protein